MFDTNTGINNDCGYSMSYQYFAENIDHISNTIGNKLGFIK